MDYDYRLDFVVVGESSVGKTCLLFRFTKDYFSTDHSSTIGVDFGTRIVDIGDARVKVHIWDTAGQENYRSVTKSYFRNACAALLVYDVSARDTFNHIAEWLGAVSAGANHNIEIVLIGNKCDLNRREVSYEEGAAFAEEKRLVFWETSAKTGHNVKDVFEQAVRRVFNNIRGNMYDLRSGANGIRVINPTLDTGGDRKRRPCCAS